MNSTRQLVAIGVAAFIMGLTPTVHGGSISQTLVIERYTVLTNGSLKYETGNLLDNGQFRVQLSEIVGSIYYDSLAAFLPISGRPIIPEYLYSGYKAARIIPHWVRSRDVFYVGTLDLLYVIVATAGKDPNPVPVITHQPQSQRVLLGDCADFYVDASPFLYLSYQWRFKGKPLPGETDSLLWIDEVTSAHGGTYSVSLTTGGKSIVSKSALLQVVKPVVVTTPPKSQTIKASKSVVFRVAVSGTGPFTYQWYYNGSQIANATKSFYSITKVQFGNAGKYEVVVGNGLSHDLSKEAVLTVQ